MAENQATEALFDVAEQLLEWGIFMLKCLIPIIWLQSIFSPFQFLVLSVVVLLGYFLLTLSPPHDSAEPPLVKPKIPVLGHLIGLARSQVSYYSHISTQTQLPAATLPIAHRKVYVLFDPILQQAAIKSKDMEAQSFELFASQIFGLTENTVHKIVGRDKDMESSHGTTDMEQVFKVAFSGDRLSKLINTKLGALADTLNAISDGQGVEAENLFQWLRETVSRATSKALWGEKANPYLDEEVMEAQWNFDTHMDNLLLGFLPSIVARTAYYARKRVNAALEPYYRAHYDQDDPTVSEFVRGRARVLRSYGLPDDEIAKHEVSIMIAATTNAIPTLFWCNARMFVHPGLLAEIRDEVSSALAVVLPTIAEDESNSKSDQEEVKKEIKIPLVGLEAKCPLLASVHKECLRLASQAVTARRVLADTTVFNPDGGQTYLLKANKDVIMPAKVVHRNPAIWGANDADTFNPRRFLDTSEQQGKQLEKESGSGGGGEKLARLRKAAFVPFGGGRFLCPARKAVYMENVAIMAAVALGFEVVGLDEGCLVMGDTGRGGIASPLEGMEGAKVNIRRREGWEGVVWSFG
ncbi:cytochrome P450 [Cercophora scortea]|uniref:Cytochrome P450 n=1 Tax=Cercophora scortea TaxID=314031 RepID=A0AAE0I477_9PEZI|nr:cytochrome P450 [Cercophora scortea]